MAAPAQAQLAQAIHDLAILRAAADSLGEPVYIFGDDAADYFNQLAKALEEWWKLGIVFLRDEESLLTPPLATDDTGNKLFFVSERRLGFGTHPASNVAQRFSDALLTLFRDQMDAADAPHLAADRRPEYLAWRDARARIKRANKPRADVAQHRLYFAHMYTDDPIIAVVGVARALRALRVWRALTTDVGLLMTIPVKRTLGVWARWLGALLFASLGIAVIPKAELLRAAARMRAAVAGTLDFSTYRLLVGMLEHFRCVNCAPPVSLHALYQPHKDHAKHQDLHRAVSLESMACAQITERIRLAAEHGGAPFPLAVPALRSPRTPHPHLVAAFADAATDSSPPGLARYRHGLFWYCELTPLHVTWLHISALELLATGFNAIVFAGVLSSSQRILLLSDALAAPHVLARRSARSPILRFVLQRLLQEPEYVRVADFSDIAQINGDANAAADTSSSGIYGERSNNSLADGATHRPRSFAERLALPEAASFHTPRPAPQPLHCAGGPPPSAPPISVAGRLPLAASFRPEAPSTPNLAPAQQRAAAQRAASWMGCGASPPRYKPYLAAPPRRRSLIQRGERLRPWHPQKGRPRVAAMGQLRRHRRVRPSSQP